MLVNNRIMKIYMRYISTLVMTMLVFSGLRASKQSTNSSVPVGAVTVAVTAGCVEDKWVSEKQLGYTVSQLKNSKFNTPENVIGEIGAFLDLDSILLVKTKEEILAQLKQEEYKVHINLGSGNKKVCFPFKVNLSSVRPNEMKYKEGLIHITLFKRGKLHDVYRATDILYSQLCLMFLTHKIVNACEIVDGFYSDSPLPLISDCFDQISRHDKEAHDLLSGPSGGVDFKYFQDSLLTNLHRSTIQYWFWPRPIDGGIVNTLLHAAKVLYRITFKEFGTNREVSPEFFRSEESA